jgi:hypothetical protein
MSVERIRDLDALGFPGNDERRTNAGVPMRSKVVLEFHRDSIGKP